MSTKESSERKKEFKTTVDGQVVKRFYTQADIPGGADASVPGSYPFTRHVMANGYRGRLWTMRQYAGFATVEETNKRYKYLFQQGTTGFSVAFHLPTQEGYDSDDPMSAGEVGKTGVAIDSLQDMEELWNGIPLADVSTSMTINATAAILLAMYIAAAEKQGVADKVLKGTVQNDILKEYIARNTYVFAPAPSMRLVTDICSYCAEKLPEWNSISISGYHIREAGSTATQEVAFTLADGIAYVDAMIARGMAVDSFLPRFSFFAANTNLFEEVAKFRAARRMWAKIVKERYKSDNARSQMLRFHVQTDGYTLTAQQPLNNIVRVAIQSLAGCMGGCQSLHTNSFDEALALPTEQAVQVALRTQQIIAEESGVADTVDPMAGSYYMETLTNQIEEAANVYIKKIDEMGGASEAIRKGYIQSEIARSSYDYQKAVDVGEQVVVGVNKYANKKEDATNILEVDYSSVEKRQVARLKQLKSSRDNAKVKKALEDVRKVARTNENIMPVLIDTVKTYATVGEICNALRDVFGEYREPSLL